MNEKCATTASSDKCQKHRTQEQGTSYQPSLTHPKLEDGFQSNFTGGSTSDSECKFVADVLCKCGALANLWSNFGNGLFICCRECGDFRILDSEDIEDLEDVLMGEGIAAEATDQSSREELDAL